MPLFIGKNNEAKQTTLFIGNKNGQAKQIDTMFIGVNNVAKEVSVIPKWKEVSTLPYSFRGGSAVVIDDNIHIMGGTGTDAYYKHYTYNKIDKQWIQQSDLPMPLRSGSAVTIGNSIHIFGSSATSSSGSTNYYYINEETGEWTKGTNITSYYGGAAVSYKFNNHNYIAVFGNASNSSSTNSRFIYKRIDASWLTRNSPYTSHGAAVVVGNHIHVFDFNTHYVLTINNGESMNLWEGASNLPFLTGASYSCSAVFFKNKIHVLGVGDDYLKHYSFDLISNEWKEELDLPFPYGGNAVVFGGKIHILGITNTIENTQYIQNGFKHYAYG